MGGGGGRREGVTPRVLTRLGCRHPRRVLLKVTFFRMSRERGGRESLKNSYIDELSSTLHIILYFSLTGRLQICGPTNRVWNYPALENIYYMLILQIRAFSLQS